MSLRLAISLRDCPRSPISGVPDSVAQLPVCQDVPTAFRSHPAVVVAPLAKQAKVELTRRNSYIINVSRAHDKSTNLLFYSMKFFHARKFNIIPHTRIIFQIPRPRTNLFKIFRCLS